MSRRSAAVKRQVLPDAKYNNVVLAKFINNLMYDGKKSVAETIVYDALDSIAQRNKTDAVEFFLKALDNVGPTVEVKSRRVGGATYQVPVEVRPSRKMAIAMRWLIEFSRKRSEKDMTDRLVRELEDAYNERGASIKKREDTHKMAEANKAFSHYRF